MVVGKAAGWKELAADKRIVGSGRKDVSEVQEIEELGDGKAIVVGKVNFTEEDVLLDNGSELGKQNEMKEQLVEGK